MSAPRSDAPGSDGAATVARLLVPGLRAKARGIVFLMALALVAFVWLAADAGRPVWLVTLIGFFGVILIGMFMALVWFWLHVFGARGRKEPDNARE